MKRLSLESGIGPSAGEHKPPAAPVKTTADAEPAKSEDLEHAAVGARILQRLKPATDKGAGYRRDPETGFVFYSSEWLSDAAATRRLRVVK